MPHRQVLQEEIASLEAACASRRTALAQLEQALETAIADDDFDQAEVPAEGPRRDAVVVLQTLRRKKIHG